MEEDVFKSCKAIIHFLANENDEDVRQLKYKDFMYKFNQLQTPPKSVLKAKTKVDIIIFTVVENEYNALKRLLPIDKKTVINNKKLNGIKAWEVDIERSGGRDNLNALIVYIGETGDLECSIAAMRVFQEYDCDLAVLCGIAAGLPDEIKRYSVIISKGIVDYEPQRLEPDRKIIYRPQFYTINGKELMRDIQYMKTEPDDWRNYYIETVSKYGDIIESEFDIKQVEESELKVGIIASGKKLFADDDNLKILRESITFDKGIVAVEMESAGFCIACNEFNNNWLGIRGISDYGSTDKNDKYNKKYQHIAAFGAFTALLYYLKYNYKRTYEEGGSMDDF
jgi:nucleoside phosphorylase